MKKKLKELWESWDEPIWTFKDVLKLWLLTNVIEIFVVPLVILILRG